MTDPVNGPGDEPAAGIPWELRNWQVIDGEATVVEDRPAGSGVSAQPAAPTIQAHVHEAIIATLETPRVTVDAGGTATLDLRVLNNGGERAAFEINVEGWIDEQWFADLPLRLHLRPGERETVSIPVAPPRLASSRVGEHPLAVVVRAVQDPNCYCRVPASLVIRGFQEVRLGTPEPLRVSSSWLKRPNTVALPLTNLSNQALDFQVYSSDKSGRCSYTFYVPGVDESPMGRARVHLEAGQAVQLLVSVTPIIRPLIGLAPQIVPFRLVAAYEEEGTYTRRTVNGQLTNAPLIGPWQLAAISSLLLMAIVAVGLAGLAALLALRSTPEQPRPVATAVAQPAPPVVALVIKVGEPVPAHVTVAQPTGIQAPAATAAAGASLVKMADGSMESAPVVSPDLVTAPGAPTPIARLRSVRPAAAPPVQTPAVAERHMTYAQMFQSIAGMYDLNWRLLAAQAYVESGFDSTALGSNGDFGLMQIRPSTWREWAPTLDVTDPFDSYSNVLVGAAYLNYLRSFLGQKGYRQQEWMFVAYNWGPDKLMAFLNNGGTWDTLGNDRRQYALDIMRIAQSIPAN